MAYPDGRIHYMEAAPYSRIVGGLGTAAGSDHSISSGKERAPLAHDGIVDRVGLRPGQVVGIRLKARGKPNALPVLVTALDGGELRGTESLSLDAGGKTQFEYKGAMMPGRYRVLLAVGGDEYIFEFCVLDLDHPENNPPRVRVVD